MLALYTFMQRHTEQYLAAFKSVLLVLHAIGSYYGMSPPTSAPKPSEQKRFARPDYLDKRLYCFLTATIISKVGVLASVPFHF